MFQIKLGYIGFIKINSGKSSLNLSGFDYHVFFSFLRHCHFTVLTTGIRRASCNFSH